MSSSIEPSLATIKPKHPRLTRRDHWRLFQRDVRLAIGHLWAVFRP